MGGQKGYIRAIDRATEMLGSYAGVSVGDVVLVFGRPRLVTSCSRAGLGLARVGHSWTEPNPCVMHDRAVIRDLRILKLADGESRALAKLAREFWMREDVRQATVLHNGAHVRHGGRPRASNRCAVCPPHPYRVEAERILARVAWYLAHVPAPHTAPRVARVRHGV
jgi:hypothetical protein